jgi:cytochrome bd-type quinol oxidase subunit 2
MATFLLKFGKLIAAVVACVACMVSTGTGAGWLADKAKGSKDDKKMKAEMISFWTFFAVFVCFSLIGWVMKKLGL